MELSQLRYFKTVAELEHFTHAAEQLHLAQPSLSKSISSLETQLGVPLFDRNKRSVVLNEYGKSLLVHVNRILDELEDAQSELTDLKAGECGNIRIASYTMFSEPSPIFYYTNRFFLEHPNIGVHTYIQNNAQIHESLLSRQIDFGFSLTPPSSNELEGIELFQFRLGLAVSKDHPLANRKSVRLQEFSSDRFLCNNTSMDLSDSVFELCHKAGFHPNVIFEGESPRLIGQAIQQNIGVAFVSDVRHEWQHRQTADYPWEADICFLPVEDPFCVRTVYMYQRRNRYLSAAAKLFRDGLLEHLTMQ